MSRRDSRSRPEEADHERRHRNEPNSSGRVERSDEYFPRDLRIRIDTFVSLLRNSTSSLTVDVPRGNGGDQLQVLISVDETFGEERGVEDDRLGVGASNTETGLSAGGFGHFEFDLRFH